MSYRVIDGVSIMVQKSEENLEEFILDKAVSLDRVLFFTEFYLKNKISKEEYISKINPSLGAEVYETYYAKKVEQYENIPILRKAKRLHDSLDVIEIDELGNCYLTNHSWVIPKSIVEKLLDAKFNPNSHYTVDSLLLFLKQLMLCPNKNVRDNAINYIERNGMFITSNGMLLTFRRVNNFTTSYNTQIESIYTKIKIWKKAPKNYTLFENEKGDIIYKSLQSTTLFIETDDDYYNNIGNLEDLYNSMNKEGKTIYTPGYSDHTTFFINGEEKQGSPFYQLGVETRLPREYCDESDSTCSRGLHTWSKLDHLNYTSFGNTILAVLISPVDFVSCPYQDNSKMRSAAIYPIAELEIKDLEEFDESCLGEFNEQYFNYTVDYINAQFLLNKEERIININQEINNVEALKALVDIEQIVKSRTLNIYD